MADTKQQTVLIIGGHSRTALIATPKLIQAGHDVTSVIRNPNHVSDIEAVGATPLIRDIVGLEVETWENRMSQFDVVVWAATSARDIHGPGDTYALDRDAASTSVEAMRNLRARGEHTPRYLMVSFLGALTRTTDPDDLFHSYAESKKQVDEELLALEGEDVLILAPGVLTMEESSGGELLGKEVDDAVGDLWNNHTSRYLVADLITEMIGRDTWPETKVLQFKDGSTPVSEF